MRAEQVIERAEREWSSKHAALLPRARFCAGDFFGPGTALPRAGLAVSCGAGCARTCCPKLLLFATATAPACHLAQGTCSKLAKTEHAVKRPAQALLPRADTIPEARNGDAYVFRLIFHDWDDDATVRILRAVLQAVGKCAATLLIVEVCPRSPPRQPPFLSRFLR